MVNKVIENRLVEINVGSIIENAAGRTEKLLPSDWDKANFRFPNPIWDWRETHAIACNIQITGRTFQYRQGDYYVKVRIEWVGDGEPNSYSEGWAKVNPWVCQHAG
jgi:hypothetical protein